MTGQFVIAEGKDEQTGRSSPLATVLWAKVSSEVDDRIGGDRGQILQLSQADWRSGDIVWMTVAAGEQSPLRHMLGRLRETTFKGRQVKLFSGSMEGSPDLVTLDPR